MNSIYVRTLGRIGWVVVLLLTFVALMSVATRFQFVLNVLDGQNVRTNPFDNRYAAHPWLTLAHISAGLVFMLAGPLQFMSSIRKRWPLFHRATGRLYILASLVGVSTALAIVPGLPMFGTFTAKAGTVLASIVFLVSIAQAYRHIARRRIREHREWMIRGYAIGLGIATFRVLIPILMSPPFSVSFEEAWDTVVWMGFAINLLCAEVWINLTRPASGRSQ